MNDFIWLQNWYAAQCNGEWEHQYGIQIDTIDNPGWRLRISLQKTGFESSDFAIEQKGETDWFVCKIHEGIFEAYGGSKNLEDIFAAFRKCVESTQQTKGRD